MTRTSDLRNLIVKATRNLTLSQFLGSLGLDQLGKRRAHLMMQAAGRQLDTLEDWRSGQLGNPTIAEAAGVPNIGGQIQDGIDLMASVINKLLAAGVTVLPPENNNIPSSEETPMKTVCISGKLQRGKKKADYADPLHVIGYELVDEVSKGLDYQVLAYPESTSSKAEKARKLKIAIISEEALEQLIAKGPEAQAAVRTTPLFEASFALATVKKNAAPIKHEKPAAQSVQVSVPSDASFRRFKLNEGKSPKFWSIRSSGLDVEVRYGRIGTGGLVQTKSFDNLEDTEKHVAKVNAEKTVKGYGEVV